LFESGARYNFRRDPGVLTKFARFPAVIAGSSVTLTVATVSEPPNGRSWPTAPDPNRPVTGVRFREG